MTIIPRKLSNLAAASLVALLAIGGGLAGTSPALAQYGEPAFDFSLDLGIQGEPRADFRVERDEPSFRRGRHHDFADRCLSDRQLIVGLRHYGFSRVEVLNSNRRRAEAIGRYDRADYLMSVNKCSGRVEIVERLRRPHRSGFGLHLGYAQ